MYHNCLHSIHMQILDSELILCVNSPEDLEYPDLMSHPGFLGALLVLSAKFTELYLTSAVASSCACISCQHGFK